MQKFKKHITFTCMFHCNLWVFRSVFASGIKKSRFGGKYESNYFWFAAVSFATWSDVGAMVNGSPSLVWKKANILLSSSRSSRACFMATHTHTRTCATSHRHSRINSCAQSGRKTTLVFPHDSGMGLEDKVSLLEHGWGLWQTASQSRTVMPQ